MSLKNYHFTLLTIVLIFWAWSGIGLHDTRLTWVLETVPCMIALPIILFTYKSFPLTNLTYTLIAIHAMILMVGGHYSYAKMPLGFWMEDWFGWTRNNYDKIGHFMQGFGPAIYTREIIKWLASLSNPADTEAFLGTQSYIWDTQTDMFWCLIGSVTAIIVLTRRHNKYLLKIGMR